MRLKKDANANEQSGTAPKHWPLNLQFHHPGLVPSSVLLDISPWVARTGHKSSFTILLHPPIS